MFQYLIIVATFSDSRDWEQMMIITQKNTEKAFSHVEVESIHTV